MFNEPDISVVIATHNRADILNDTLNTMSQIDRKGINAEFVIVDNNSTDNTKEIIESFKDKMPVKYLFEPKPGQNCARNRALSDAKLGRIVAFTDDDIEPNINWLHVINHACNQWPDYEIFGGRIYPIWPLDTDIPKWTEIRFIQELGYAAHDYKKIQALYEKEHYPSSGNFWVRRKLLAEGVRFDNSIEWHPKNRIMATETTFFRNLVEQGYRIVHCPEAVVGHKITTEQLSVSNLLKRSYSWGRGIAHIRPFYRPEMLNKNPLLWHTIRYAAITKLGFKLTASMVPLVFDKPQAAMYAMQWLGYNKELLNLAEKNMQ